MEAIRWRQINKKQSS